MQPDGKERRFCAHTRALLGLSFVVSRDTIRRRHELADSCSSSTFSLVNLSVHASSRGGAGACAYLSEFVR